MPEIVVNRCVECGAVAHYWNSHFCEECFIKVLQNKIRDDDDGGE